MNEFFGAIKAFFSFGSAFQKNRSIAHAKKARCEMVKLEDEWDKVRLYIADCVSRDEEILYSEIKDEIHFIGTKIKKTQKHLNKV